MNDNNDISNRQKAFLSASGGSSNTTTGGGAGGQVLDANSLQMAYLAVQLRGMQQASMAQTSSQIAEPTAFVSTSSSGPSSSALAGIYNEAALQQFNNVAAQTYFDFQSAQTHSVSQQQFASGQSSILDHLIPAPSSSTQLNRNAGALELMLLQMHMAAAAANNATLLPHVALNFLPQPTFNALNNQHLQLSQPSDILSSTNTLSNQLSNLSHPATCSEFPNISSTNFPDTNSSTFTQEYLARFLANCEDTAAASNSNEISSLASHLKPRSHSVSRGDAYKRSFDDSLSHDMNLLRSMCAEGIMDIGMTPLKKRFKKFSFDETQTVSTAVAQEANVEGISRPKEERLIESGKRNGTRRARTTSVGNSNSPHRHHPYNHRPPAMEARFLECMAAIALHSDFSVPPSSERMEERRHDETDEDETSEVRDEVLSAGRSESGESPSCTKDKVTWSNSAIDEELFEEYENYKDKVDVPKIHAYVLPTAAGDSGPDTSVDDGHESPSVKSLAVPVPVVNLLLDRILNTMLVET